MRLTLSCLALLVLTACPASVPPEEDAGLEPFDAGEAGDAGADAGMAFDAGPPDAGFGSVAIEGWCQARAWATCTRQERCLSLSPARFDACLQRVAERCDQAAYTSGVQGGRLQYLPTKAGECLDAYAKGSCTGEPAECAGLFQGLVAPDGACLLNEECTSNGFCNKYANTCPFRCNAYRQLGESCDGLSSACEPQVSTCQLGDAGFHQCAPARLEGEACDAPADCREDLSCQLDVCVKRWAKLGESCGEVGPYPLCIPEGFCRQEQAPQGVQAPPGVCMPRVGLGGTCTGQGSCLPSLRCSTVFATGVCITKGAEGDTCTVFGDCQDELFCLDRTSRCTALPTDGGDCTSGGSAYQCAPGYFCNFAATDYACALKLADRQPCSYSSACRSGICKTGLLEDGGYGGACVPRCSSLWDGGN